MSGKTTSTVSMSPWRISWSMSLDSMVSPGCGLGGAQLALDGLQLVGGALDPRPFEPRAGAQEPVGTGEDDHRPDSDDGIVERLDVDRSGLGQHEQDRDEGDPGHGNDGHRSAPSAQRPGPRCEPGVGPQAKKNRETVGHVQPGDRT